MKNWEMCKFILCTNICRSWLLYEIHCLCYIHLKCQQLGSIFGNITYSQWFDITNTCKWQLHREWIQLTSTVEKWRWTITSLVIILKLNKYFSKQLMMCLKRTHTAAELWQSNPICCTWKQSKLIKMVIYWFGFFPPILAFCINFSVKCCMQNMQI